MLDLQKLDSMSHIDGARMALFDAYKRSCGDLKTKDDVRDLLDASMFSIGYAYGRLTAHADESKQAGDA